MGIISYVFLDMLYKKGKRLKRYKDNEKKNNKLIYAIQHGPAKGTKIEKAIIDNYCDGVIFAPREENYESIKTAKEVNIDNESDISEILENASKGVVRNIKNCNK